MAGSQSARAPLGSKGPVGRRGELAEHRGGPHGSHDEIAAAIRARTLKFRIGAIAAVRTFESADHGVEAVRGQIPIAAFAAWLHKQHPRLLFEGMVF